MKEFDYAQLLHDQLDSEYARKLFRATSNNHAKAIARYAELRRINDGAYFLIIFGTFERHVTDKAEIAVKARTNKIMYRYRRVWETLLNGPELTATFMNRVRVLLDQQSHEFEAVKKYYQVRNDLAHEGATTKVFSIPNVVNDLKSANRMMKP